MRLMVPDIEGSNGKPASAPLEAIQMWKNSV
jgi:hypothetical protein